MTKVLCAGDLHIGRRSSKIPSDLDGPDFSCAAAWSSLVELAIRERVDLVALSGDLVDLNNRFFEAIGPLERGLRRLDTEGITAVAVSGNHDFDVLPRLCDELKSSHFHFLGRGGDWERFTLQRNGSPLLHVDGRSFVQELALGNPLDGYAPATDGVPVLGLLHADLDQRQSHYGPVELFELRRQPVDFWLLGHIHRPALYSDGVGAPVLYPGTPQAMDPGETGRHGAWIVDFQAGGSVRERQLPLSTVRYESVTLDLTDVDSEERFQSAVISVLRSTLDKIAEHDLAVKCLCCRLVLTGRTPLHRKLPDYAGSAQSELDISTHGIRGSIENVTFETRPAVNVDLLASRNDPPGEVARMIKAFERAESPTDYQDLVAATVGRLRAVHDYRSFSDLSEDNQPGTIQAREYLLHEAWSLLDSLVAQKEDA